MNEPSSTTGVIVALIEDETGKFGATPMIMFILGDQHTHHMQTAPEEVKARGAELIIYHRQTRIGLRFGQQSDCHSSKWGILTALGGVLPLCN